MPNMINIGKIVSTHGIKGELKIISDQEQIKNILIPGNILRINSKEYVLNTYRHHKIYELITLQGFNNINQVLPLINKDVYIKREDIKVNDYLLDDLLNFEVFFQGKLVGKVVNIIRNKQNILLQIKHEKTFYIPHVSEFIEQVDLKNEKIIVKNIEGLIL